MALSQRLSEFVSGGSFQPYQSSPRQDSVRARSSALID